MIIIFILKYQQVRILDKFFEQFFRKFVFCLSLSDVVVEGTDFIFSFLLIFKTTLGFWSCEFHVISEMAMVW